VWVGVAQSV